MPFIEALADAMLFEGIPVFIRSDNCSEMVSKVLRQWMSGLRTKSLYIEPGSPWENGYCESLNGKLKDELLNGEIFYSLQDAKVVIERWRFHYIQKETAFGPRMPSTSARHHRTATRTRRNHKHAIVSRSTYYKMSVRPPAIDRSLAAEKIAMTQNAAPT
jgi:hypothetical protein